MTSDINPHWKNVGAENSANADSFWPMPPEDAPPEQPKRSAQVHHVRIEKKGISLFLLAALAPVLLALLAFVFLQGVHLIRADLTEGIVPDRVVTIGSDGFSPDTATVSVGQLIQWKNMSGTAQDLRSDETNTDGSPLLTFSLGRDETFPLKISTFLAGKTLTFHNGILPTALGTVTFTEATHTTSELPAPSPITSPITVTRIAPPSSVPEVAQPATIPALPSLPLPVAQPVMITLPSSNPNPNPIPVSIPALNLGLGGTVAPPSPTAASNAWPLMLRINANTVDRISSLSPTSQLPIHAVARAREEVRSAIAKHPPAHHQPETGPALWIVAALSLCCVPFLLRGKRTEK